MEIKFIPTFAHDFNYDEVNQASIKMYQYFMIFHCTKTLDESELRFYTQTAQKFITEEIDKDSSRYFFFNFIILVKGNPEDKLNVAKKAQAV